MIHGTTLPVPAHTGLPSPPRASLDQGHGPEQLSVEVDGPRVRVRASRVSTQWLPDTPGNRHLTVVWLRLLVDRQDQPLFTLQA
jgi:hypothetical protein